MLSKQACLAKKYLYSWGKWNSGLLGCSPSDVPHQFHIDGFIACPIKVHSLSKWRVSSVACGLRHTLCLTMSGFVYSWGIGSKGQLGIGGSEEEPDSNCTISQLFQRNLPQQITALKGCKVLKIAAGGHSSACVGETRLGKFLDEPVPSKMPVKITLEWGEALFKPRYNQPICNPVENHRYPVVIDVLKRKEICQLVIGQQHALALDEKTGRVHVWGDNTYGQLGLVRSHKRSAGRYSTFFVGA